MPQPTSPSWQDAVSIVPKQITPEGVHVWPFNESWPLDMRFFILNRRGDLPPHRPSHFELIHLDSGEIVYEAQGVKSCVKKGDLVVVGNRLFHRMLKTGYMRPEVRATILYFTPKFFENWRPPADVFQCLMPFLYQTSVTPHVVPARTQIPSKVFDLFHMLRPELAGTSSRSRLAAGTYVKMILVLLLNYFSESPETKRGFAQALRELEIFLPLMEFLEANCTRPITAEDGARALGMTKWQFARLVKRVTGQSFLQYLIHFRVERAKALLAGTQKPISELCQEVGFCDQSYFGYVFRRIAAVTPLQYRQENWYARKAVTTLAQPNFRVLGIPKGRSRPDDG